ncbi:ImmA/IrrE family metallo-endopeptidase [Corynebacterium pilosum]|uniref:Domain of uncharacterized function (DUF955) n=1 Tax=Corynebacterium pilosum TaxID=35756 RepID=A0A376CJE2_9CORY|nr:ImmA/IrrE family metallo-endopeptidase [Corynebacterium pilosum]STC68554.1 Domain of uncharacterised function (DUF955) [Corynebacterium pilosum]
MVTRVPARPHMVQWALDQATDPDAAIEKTPHLIEWLEGTQQPTFRELERFASRVGVPFGFFLLDQEPDFPLSTNDFREGTQAHGEASAELRQVLLTCEQRQNWFREYKLNLGHGALDFVGEASDLPPKRAAALMCHALNWDVDQRRGSTSDARASLITAFEELGGLVVVNSMVGDNVHKPLDPTEFRGFSLVDEVAPLVFINSNQKGEVKQTLNAQIFTLAHEFAHVWLGTGGIGNHRGMSAPRSEIEKWCNDTASEFLVPADDLRERVRGKEFNVDLLEQLARVYKCGTLVILLALRDHQIFLFQDFPVTYREELKRLRDIQSRNDREKKGGGDSRFNRRLRIGETFSRAVINELAAGAILPTEALSLTGIKSMSSFDSYANFLHNKDN